jgi:CO dehydrogenase/acetyl-CoA synthase beta subunit
MQYDHLDKRNGMRESLHDKTPYEDHCSNGDEESEHSASTEEAVPEQMESEQEEENEEESEQSVDTEAANFWEGHELKEMAEATIPVLACVKNKAGDAYLRIGIGVMFNLKNEFWAPVIEHTGFPEEAKGFSADLDITLV